ncbi:MAG: hypothetical protein KW802_01205 [Candidatus Doudnabacteria bacterium]|nr:hypothetical protein [Candidatus Doudnabacteria bacterium]
MDQIFSIYSQFLNYFPANLHGVVSLALAVLIVIGIFKVIRKDFIYIILLIVLLPASVPILKNIWDSVIGVIKFLLTKR